MGVDAAAYSAVMRSFLMLCLFCKIIRFLVCVDSPRPIPNKNVQFVSICVMDLNTYWSSSLCEVARCSFIVIP